MRTVWRRGKAPDLTATPRVSVSHVACVGLRTAFLHSAEDYQRHNPRQTSTHSHYCKAVSVASFRLARARPLLSGSSASAMQYRRKGIHMAGTRPSGSTRGPEIYNRREIALQFASLNCVPSHTSAVPCLPRNTGPVLRVES